MERFEDISDDFALSRALEEIDEFALAAKNAHEKNKILRAALTQIGVASIEGAETQTGAYSYIPIDIDEFFDMMFTLEKCLTNDADYRHTDKPHRPVSFLEVGCGHGRNLHLLRATDRFCFEKISGFDIVPEYVEAGKNFFDLDEDIFMEDAFKFDYGGYDVIYYYRPFSDEKMQRKFENRVLKTMKRGAYIAASLSESLETSRRLISKDDRGRIWKRL